MKSYQEMLEEKIFQAEQSDDDSELKRLGNLLAVFLAQQEEAEEIEKMFDESSSNI